MSGTITPVFSDSSRKEFMLAAMRTACARVRMLALEIEEVGVSLKCDMIDAEGAVSWLDYINAVQFINTDAWPNKIEVSA